MATFQFWFDFASTYSYLSAMRIVKLTAPKHIVVEWKPFLLGPIFKTQGWHDSPFNLYPVRGRYMWRDLQRCADNYGIPLIRPSRFPINSVLAGRVACLPTLQPYLPEFAQQVFHAHFAENQDVTDQNTIIAILDKMGLAGKAIYAQAQLPEYKGQLRQNTEEAMRLDIFGAPSFIVGCVIN